MKWFFLCISEQHNNCNFRMITILLRSMEIENSIEANRCDAEWILRSEWNFIEFNLGML